MCVCAQQKEEARRRKPDLTLSISLCGITLTVIGLAVSLQRSPAQFGPSVIVVEVVGMERFLALLRLLSRRRRGRRYRADDDYQEGYEDVYYYTSKYNTHLLSE